MKIHIDAGMVAGKQTTLCGLTTSNTKNRDDAVTRVMSQVNCRQCIDKDKGRT